MTIGKKFDASRLDELQPAISSIDDAKRVLGPNSAESTSADGSKLLQWQYVQGSMIGGEGEHVAILFGPDGKMIRVTHKSSVHR